MEERDRALGAPARRRIDQLETVDLEPQERLGHEPAELLAAAELAGERAEKQRLVDAPAPLRLRLGDQVGDVAGQQRGLQRARTWFAALIGEARLIFQT